MVEWCSQVRNVLKNKYKITYEHIHVVSIHLCRTLDSTSSPALICACARVCVCVKRKEGRKKEKLPRWPWNHSTPPALYHLPRVSVHHVVWYVHCCAPNTPWSTNMFRVTCAEYLWLNSIVGKWQTDKQPAKCFFKMLHTTRVQCACAPLCSSHISPSCGVNHVSNSSVYDAMLTGLSKKRASQMSCCHIRPCQKWWIMFHLHHDMQNLPSPKHISATGIVINCALTGEGNLRAGCSIWGSITVLTPVKIWHLLCECQVIRLQIQVFLSWYLEHAKL
jgi:hypothetical protein